MPWTRLLRIFLLASLWLIPSTASAEPVRVVTDRATIWRAPSGVGGILDIVRTGTVLDVEGRRGRWLIVRSPSDPRQVGYILAAQTELVPDNGAAGSGAGTGLSRRPPGANPPVAARRSTRPPPRAIRQKNFFELGGVLPAGHLDFSLTQSVPLLLETSTRTESYSVPFRPGIEGFVGRRLTPQLSVLGGLGWSSMTGTVDVTLEVPHPIFYGVPRTTEGQGRSGHSELTASAFLQWDLIRFERVTVAIAAGPTFHRLSQELVTEVSYLEEYPYDAIEFESLQVARETVNAVGGTVQVSARIPNPRYQLEVFGRWGVGKAEFADRDGQARLGTARVGIGLRVPF